MPPVTIYDGEDASPQPFFPQQALFEYLLPDAPGVSPLPAFDNTLPAFIDGPTGRVLTRGGLRDAALRIASGLHRAGMQRGDVVALWGPNSLEWAEAAYGAMAAGITVTAANIAYSPNELAHQINNSGATMMLVDPSLLATFDAARPLFTVEFPPHRVVLLARLDGKPAGSKLQVLSEIYHEPAVPAKFDGAAAQSTALLCYSSGTTGLPKGVMLTHFNMTAQLQASITAFPELLPGRDVVLGVLPFCHVYGFVVQLLHPLTRGVPVVVLPKFEEVSMLTAVQKYRVSHALIVPPILIVLLHSKTMDRYDLSSLRSLVCAAAPLSQGLQVAFNARVPDVVLLQGYGMTECSPATHAMTRDEAVGRAGSVGRLMPGYQARLVDEGGVDVKRGSRGELWLRGPCVMKGYYNNPESTAKTMEPGGWLKTGDILRRTDDGYYTVVDRVKELIKYKGLQVAPAELEGLLMTHPKVADAGVVGVWDEAQATELPRAYIVPKPEYASEPNLPEEVRDWVASRVSGHKKLRGGVKLIDVVPKSPSGKILRKILRERASKEFGDELTRTGGGVKAKL